MRHSSAVRLLLIAVVLASFLLVPSLSNAADYACQGGKNAACAVLEGDAIACHVRLGLLANVAVAWALDNQGNPLGDPQDAICIVGGTKVIFEPDPSINTSVGAAIFTADNPFTPGTAVTYAVSSTNGTPVSSSAKSSHPPAAKQYKMAEAFTNYSVHPAVTSLVDPKVIVGGDGTLILDLAVKGKPNKSVNK